jgi:CRP/FNR family transcriptional regulator
MQIDQIKQYFPELREPGLLEELEREGHLMTIDAGDRIMDVGRYIRIIPLVLDGALKITRPDEEGHELLLYYLQPGDTCAMSLTGCLEDCKSKVRADAVEETKVLGIPVEFLDEWMIKYPSWKSFIMGSYAKRFSELLSALDEVAFRNLDERLLRYLQNRVEVSGSSELQVSHQDIASELHSSREVISRLLKKMEKEGLVQLGRNRVTLLG